MKKFLFIVSFYLFTAGISYSQQNLIQNLEEELGVAAEHHKPEVLHKLSKLYMNINLDKSIDYAEEALDIARKHPIPIKLERDLNKILGDAYYVKTDYSKAIRHYRKELEIYGEYKKDVYVMKTYFRIGTAYKFTDRPRRAIEYFELSLEISKAKGLKFMILQNYIELYTLFNWIDNTRLAHEYYALYLRLYSDLRLPLVDTVAVHDTVYSGSGEVPEIQLHYESLQRENEVELMLLDSALSVSEQKRKLLLQAAANREFKILLMNFQRMLNDKHVELMEEEIVVKNTKMKQAKYTIFIFVFVSLLVLTFVALIYRQFRLKKAANQKLVESEARLKELNDTKDKFFSILAHDLKNPLNILLITTDVLSKNTSDYSMEKIQLYMRNMNKSVKSLYNLLENLLNWSRSQLGHIDFYPQREDLNDILMEVVDNVEDSANSKNIQLRNHIVQDTFVYVDRNMLIVVLRNLISNSIKFTKKGGYIDINAYQNKKDIHVEVKDTGIGMNSNDIDKLFRIDSHHSKLGTENERGSGLGLILCKEFIAKHNGEIWAESEENKGSKFIFSLPLDVMDEVPSE